MYEVDDKLKLSPLSDGEYLHATIKGDKKKEPDETFFTTPGDFSDNALIQNNSVAGTFLTVE